MRDQLELEPVAVSHGRAAGAERLPAVTVGRLTAADQERGPLVDFAVNHSGVEIPARTVVPLQDAQIGCEVALVFEDGEVTRPIIVGVMQEWNAPVMHQLNRIEPGLIEVKHDEESLLLTAAKEITLQCGKASITLTSAGKLLLRGAYLLSRSSGVNRIKGGSVQIN